MFNSIMRSSQSFIIDLRKIYWSDIEQNGSFNIKIFTFYTNIHDYIFFNIIIHIIYTYNYRFMFLLTLLFFTGGRLAIFTKK